MADNTLTIFYDGECPLCSLEMQKLKGYDYKNLIVLENLHQVNFQTLFPLINISKAMEILHGQYQGKVLLGLDVTHRAWTLVGLGALVAPLQFPVSCLVTCGSWRIKSVFWLLGVVMVMGGDFYTYNFLHIYRIVLFFFDTILSYCFYHIFLMLRINNIFETN